MQKTTNYGFNKPESTDFYNVEDFNENMDVIDEKLKSVEDSKTTINEHLNTENPHNITKSTVGLSNVPNVSTNNQTPTYTVASDAAELSSGEKLSTAFGKIAKAVSSLISHVKNKSNPHEVTKSDVGLDKVDNTSDLEKPVSNTQQAAIDAAHEHSLDYTDEKITELINGTLALDDVVDSLDSDKDNKPLSANQGRVLNEKITDLQTLVIQQATSVEVSTLETGYTTVYMTAPEVSGYIFYPLSIGTNTSACVAILSHGAGYIRVWNFKETPVSNITFSVSWLGIKQYTETTETE